MSSKKGKRFQSTHKFLEKFSLAPQEGREFFCDKRLEFVKAAIQLCHGICWGFANWLSGIMKSCRWDIGDWWMVIWMGSEGRT